MMRSSNPALKDNIFTSTFSQTDDMTIQGTVHKTAFLLFLLMAGATYSWTQVAPQIGADGISFGSNPNPYIMIGSIGGFILALITIFKMNLAPVCSPAYAVLEGLALGAISALFEARYPGVVMQSMVGTFGTLGAMLLAYRSGWVRATENFKLVVMSATGAIALMYFFTWILQLFHVPVNFLHDSSPLSIGISIIVVVVASLNLVMDFDFIEKSAVRRAPKYMEWYSAFALILTLVWLYLEILRLLSKMRERR